MTIAKMLESTVPAEDGFIGRLQLDARRSATTNLGPADTGDLRKRPVFGAVYKRNGVKDIPNSRDDSTFGDEPTHWLNCSMWDPVFDLDNRYVTSVSTTEGKRSVTFVDRDASSVAFKIHYASIPTGIFTFVEDGNGEVLFHTDSSVTLVDTLFDLGLLCFRHPSTSTLKGN